MNLDAIVRNFGSINLGDGSFAPPIDKVALHKAFPAKKIKPVTDRGVRLGMTEAQLRRILGKPDTQLWSKKFEACELIYRRTTAKDRDGNYEKYANYYLFKGGHLYFIELTKNMEPG